MRRRLLDDGGQLPTAKKRGPRATVSDSRGKRITELERQVTRVTARADRAEAIAENKEVAALLGRPFPSEDS
jgi:hypothetical protein